MKLPDYAVRPRIPRKQRSGLRVDRRQAIPSLAADLCEPSACVEHVVCDRQAPDLWVRIGDPVGDRSRGAVDRGQFTSRQPAHTGETATDEDATLSDCQSLNDVIWFGIPVEEPAARVHGG